MGGELPVFKRCCFCLPLRHGLIGFGYLKAILLICVLLFISLEIIYTVAIARYQKVSLDTNFYVFISILIMIWIIDFVMTVTFLVGGHKKSIRLLRAYYIYCIVNWMLSFLMYVTLLVLAIKRWAYLSMQYSAFIIYMDFSTYFASLMIQLYFILLLRSEILKLKSNCQFRFVNNAAESECAMKYEADDDDTKISDRYENGLNCVNQV